MISEAVWNQLFLSPPGMTAVCSDPLSLSDSLRLVTPVSLALVSIASVALVVAAVAVVGLAAKTGSWRHPALLMSALFALHNEHRVFFTRLLALAMLVVGWRWVPGGSSSEGLA